MKKDESKAESTFVSIYGQQALDGGGFTMVPNDLLDNLGTLNLTPSDMLIIFQILRLGKVRCGARKIAKRAGLSIGQTRSSYRKLDERKLIERRIDELGDVNTFSTRGIENLVRDYADKRHRDVLIDNSGIVVSSEGYMQELDTNKDSKELVRNKDGDARADQVDGAGYASARAMADKLKHRKND
jgi:hypothetical protein